MSRTGLRTTVFASTAERKTDRQPRFHHPARTPVWTSRSLCSAVRIVEWSSRTSKSGPLGGLARDFPSRLKFYVWRSESSRLPAMVSKDKNGRRAISDPHGNNAHAFESASDELELRTPVLRRESIKRGVVLRFFRKSGPPREPKQASCNENRPREALSRVVALPIRSTALRSDCVGSNDGWIRARRTVFRPRALAGVCKHSSSFW